MFIRDVENDTQILTCKILSFVHIFLTEKILNETIKFVIYTYLQRSGDTKMSERKRERSASQFKTGKGES